MRYHWMEVRKPQRADYHPGNNFINWHVREVFRGSSRCFLSFNAMKDTIGLKKVAINKQESK